MKVWFRPTSHVSARFLATGHSETLHRGRGKMNHWVDRGAGRQGRGCSNQSWCVTGLRHGACKNVIGRAKCAPSGAQRGKVERNSVMSRGNGMDTLNNRIGVASTLRELGRMVTVELQSNCTPDVASKYVLVSDSCCCMKVNECSNLKSMGASASRAVIV
jgi:hypothetical protein